MAANHNITLAIDGTLLKRARAVAARRGLSVSALLAEGLRALVADDREFESARRRAAAMLDDGLSLGGVRITDRGALMSGIVFVDSNVLIYAHDRDAGSKRELARAICSRLWSEQPGVLSIQVLQEFFVTVTRKLRTPIARA